MRRFHFIPLFLGLAVSGLGFSSLAHAASAEVKALQYPAWIEQGGNKLPVSPGMKLRPEEIIATGDGARVLLNLPDGSEMKLGQKARFTMNRLESASTAGGVNVEASLQLLAGKFRYATGALAKLTGQRQIDLKLATATIGVRGTDYWAMTDAEHDAVCLFEGKVEVANPDQGVVPLDQPTAFWIRYFDKPAQVPGNATAKELATFLGWVEMTPGAGVAVVNGRWRLVAGAEKAAADAQTLSKTLRDLGYPAVIAKSYGLHEVRIDNFASRADAETILKRLSAKPGQTGNEAKIVATR